MQYESNCVHKALHIQYSHLCQLSLKLRHLTICVCFKMKTLPMHYYMAHVFKCIGVHVHNSLPCHILYVMIARFQLCQIDDQNLTF